MSAISRPAGELTLRTLPTRKSNAQGLSLREIIELGFPHGDLPAEVRKWRRKNLSNLWRGLWPLLVARTLKIPHHYGQLQIALISPDHRRIDFGLASFRVVTKNGVSFIAQSFRGLQTISNMRYHGFGSGTTPEAASQSGLVSEFTTQYATSNTRTAGSLEQGTDSNGNALANVYRSVATTTFSAGVTVSEHGIFSQASTTSGTPAGGYLLDRTVFTAQGVVSGFGIITVYDYTTVAGG